MGEVPGGRRAALMQSALSVPEAKYNSAYLGTRLMMVLDAGMHGCCLNRTCRRTATTWARCPRTRAR